MEPEPENVTILKAWLSDHGGGFHPDVRFRANSWGLSVVARDALPSNTCIVSCPFSLVITPDVSRQALMGILKQPRNTFAGWSERQLICSYLAFHLILGDSGSHTALAHLPYLKTLPDLGKLRTSLHFTEQELEAFKGTNLYNATLDRRFEWEKEWKHCQSAVANLLWRDEFTWERYLMASTYLSSRAFPSTLLSSTPSLKYTSASHPILLPGVDSLNHARGQPVSWVVSHPQVENTNQSANMSPEQAIGSTRPFAGPSISLVIHKPTRSGQELFNNYGAKPNSELIVGYGFSLPNNPDDTIVLQVGSRSNYQGNRWEIGRDATGVQGLWEEMLGFIAQHVEGSAFEDELETAEVLTEMIRTSLARLPHNSTTTHAEHRPEVLKMLEHYVEGQRNILNSVIAFSEKKKQQAIDTARESGVELLLEDE